MSQISTNTKKDLYMHIAIIVAMAFVFFFGFFFVYLPWSTHHGETIKVPNLKGMPGMDAVALLGNLGLKVKVKGIGKVKNQSVQAGEPIIKNSTIILELS